MAAPLPFAESEIRLLTALLRARVRFMIVGLSAGNSLLAAVGLRRRPDDRLRLRLGEQARHEEGLGYFGHGGNILAMIPPGAGTRNPLANAASAGIDDVTRRRARTVILIVGYTVVIAVR